MPSEREPAKSQRVTYSGDKRHLMTDDEKQMFGPDQRGIMWRATHVEYDAEANRSLVVMRPLSLQQLAQMPGVLDELDRFQQKLAAEGRR